MAYRKGKKQTILWIEIGVGAWVLGGLIGLGVAGYAPDVVGFSAHQTEEKCQAAQQALEEHTRAFARYSRAAERLLVDRRWQEPAQRPFLARAVVDTEQVRERHEAESKGLSQAMLAMNCR